MVIVSGDIATFTYFRPHASSASVVGDFNGWVTGRTPMTRGHNGYWQASLKLSAGEFKFRYHMDGQWFVDYAAFGLEHGSFGPDSVVRICRQQRHGHVD